MAIVQALALFVLAGLAEIGGGWLVWQWLREQRPWFFGALGGLFGRVYAAYGGVFVVLSLLWGWRIDNWAPDRWDLLGAGICLIGVLLIMFGPRTA